MASRAVALGGVIAYPTEAVYGLGCNPWDIHAVARILTLKRRHPGKGLIVVSASFEQLEPLIDTGNSVPVDSIRAGWPGPITWIFPARKEVPVWLRGSGGGIAVRVTAHALTRELCARTGILVSTSANPEGYLPARDPSRLRAYFGNRIDYILTGKVGGLSAPTEIRDAVTGRVVREGGR